MAGDRDLLSRADSLINSDTGAGGNSYGDLPRQMRRRRSFLASVNPEATPDGAERFTRQAAEDDHLPLLTDIVVPTEATAEEEESSESVTASLRPALAAELAQFVDRRLAEDLPALVEAAALQTAKQLHDGIGATIASALRDFVAQRGQLQLPLDEPADSDEAAADQQ